MKKLSILVVREDLKNLLRELISLGLIQLTEPEEWHDASTPHGMVKREVIDITDYGANLDTLSALGTHFTIYFTGWIQSKSEPEMVKMLKNHTCAWCLGEPTPDEALLAPVELRFPQFLSKYRLAGRGLFAPLRSLRYIEPEGMDSDETE